MVDSTIQAINYIVKTPGNLGGRARISGRRIGVSDVVNLHLRLGAPLDEIAEHYDLSLAQIHAALAYYYDHREEIDTFLDEEQRLADEAIEKQYGGEEGLRRHKAELEQRLKERNPDAYRKLIEYREQHPDGS